MVDYYFDNEEDEKAYLKERHTFKTSRLEDLRYCRGCHLIDVENIREDIQELACTRFNERLRAFSGAFRMDYKNTRSIPRLAKCLAGPNTEPVKRVPAKAMYITLRFWP
jgi:hypothetical protein